MKKLFNQNSLILTATLILSSNIAYAVPADPRPKTYTQPDGTTLTVKIRGDEHSHYLLTEDDYLLVSQDDALYYGKVADDGSIVRSDILATDKSLRSASATQYLQSVDMAAVYEALRSRADGASRHKAPAKGPGLFAEMNFPSKGAPKALVVLVEYTDVKFQLDDPHDYFSRMLMEQGFSDYGGTGSVYDFFNENSCGQFQPQFDLYGPLTLDHNMAYYGGNDWWGNDQNPEQMVIEACNQLDETVDFTEYDTNGDGYIDNVFIFYAGRGEASGGSASSVWPHSWDVSSATSTPYYYDGVRLDRYGCTNEWEGSRPDGIGTFVHEFSHVMGLPDLYATSYTGAFTPGSWSALDYGPYNNNGCTPPNYGAFERYALDWMNPVQIKGPANVYIDKISTNEAYIIKTTRDEEYFLFENRQKEGWDKYIPGHGMLVWHVDYDESVWTANTVNNSSSHQYVDIEEADNEQNEYSRSGDAFPGTANVTSFTDDTHPSMKMWNGTRLELPIADIEERNGIISFHVCGGIKDVDPVVLEEATNITGTSFEISWSEEPNARSYLVSVYTKSFDGEREVRNFLPGWSRQNVGRVLSATVTGLWPETQYYCVVYAHNGAFSSDDSNEIAVLTGAPTLDFKAPVAQSATDVESDSFVANWEAMEDANGYYIDVYTKGDYVLDTDICDFTGGINNMPAGWVTSSKLTYANTAYSGEAIPSLRLAQANAYVASPVYTSEIKSFSFWHRGSSIDPNNTVKVYARVGNAYTLLEESAITTDAGGRVMTYNDLPGGVYGIKIEYCEATHKGSLAIDDIHVDWNYHRPHLSLFDFAEGAPLYYVGDVLSYKMSGLSPETTYYYRVTATDGNLCSLISNEVEVTTAEGSGITDALAAADIRILDDAVEVRSLPSTPVIVTDVLGRVITTSKTDTTGHAYVQIPARGVYMLRIGTQIMKIKL